MRFYSEASAACSSPRSVESGKKCRFVPDMRLCTDRDAAVRPLRPIDAAFHAARHARWNSLLGALIGERAEEQLVPKVSVESRRSLADDGLGDQQPQSHSPCITDVAACSAVLILAQLLSAALR